MVNPFAYIKSKFALKLWGAMMLLVAFGVAFLWFVQIALFEPNYIHATIDLLRKQIEQVVREFKDDGGRSLLAELSKTISGKVFVADKNGQVLVAYSMGSLSKPDERLPGQTPFWERSYRYVIGGATVKSIINKGEPGMKVVMGFPIRYRGEPAALFLYNSLAELHTMQVLVYKELLVLTVASTVVASLLAFALTRHFTRPILAVKETVDRLAAGDLEAKPNVSRTDELGKLSDSVDDLGVALRRVDVLRREVISNVSHELRAPLAVITGYGEMLRDITWRDERVRAENLDLIINEADRLSRMVDDILDYSQLQAGYGKLARTPCNMYDVAASEVAFCAPVARDYGLSIVLESFSRDVPVDVDALKITQVLRNLINNAINHTASESGITVRIEERGAVVRVSVINPGDEIPEGERRTIWERYQRVQHQAGRHEGTGIGLSIVAAILSAHGFAYGVECVGGDNIFWFDAALKSSHSS